MNPFRELQRALSVIDVDEIPEGWKSIAQWAAESKVDYSRAALILREALRKSMVERRSFRVHNGVMVRPIVHYKIIRQKAGQQ